MVYSLVETAKANGINVYAYLQYLLINVADGDWYTELGVLNILILLLSIGLSVQYSHMIWFDG